MKNIEENTLWQIMECLKLTWEKVDLCQEQNQSFVRKMWMVGIRVEHFHYGEYDVSEI